MSCASQIQQGKRRVAIFYGAGHLSDMERRLVADFGLQKESQRWLVAWSITRGARASFQFAEVCQHSSTVLTRQCFVTSASRALRTAEAATAAFLYTERLPPYCAGPLTDGPEPPDGSTHLHERADDLSLVV